MMPIDTLVTIVPPPKKPRNAGTAQAWKRIKERVDIPDELFDLFHRYGSGQFTVYMDDGMDVIRLLNVFEKPLLELQTLIGTGFEENKSENVKLRFFPRSRYGLFPITESDQSQYLLVDPRDEKKVYVTDKFASGLLKCNYSALDFLCIAFTGEKELPFVASLKRKPLIVKVMFHQNPGDAFRKRRNPESV